MMKVCLAIFCLLLFCELKAQNSSSNWAADQNFCMSDGALVDIWGAGKKIPGTYFDEYLPAFFERKLAFETFDLKGSTFQWILKGNNGALKTLAKVT
jgi:hypothetical protein